MLYTGLVSVTFRQLKPAEIIPLVQHAGLDAIEWGGDVHVPPGDLACAREVSLQTRAAGLVVSSYGSYYRAGCEDASTSFADVLASARELGAPTIRIWAGDRASAEADGAWWQQVIEDSRRAGLLAAQDGIKVAFEYHENTLTDTPQSAIRLLRALHHANVDCYWQPLPAQSEAERMLGLEMVLPRLSNIHVYHLQGSGERRPLAEGKDDWTRYLRRIASQTGDRFCLLEFVVDDSPERFLEDARVLKDLCTSSSVERW